MLNFWIELVLNYIHYMKNVVWSSYSFIYYTVSLNIGYPFLPKLYELNICLRYWPHLVQGDARCKVCTKVKSNWWSLLWSVNQWYGQSLRSTLHNVSAVTIRPSLCRPRWPVWILWVWVCRSLIFNSLRKLYY